MAMKEEEFDPSTSEEFYRNLDRALQEAAEEEEAAALSVSLDSDFEWIEIGEETAEEETAAAEDVSRTTEDIDRTAEEEVSRTIEEEVSQTAMQPVLPPQEEAEDESEEELLRVIDDALAEQIAAQFEEASGETSPEEEEEKKAKRRVPIWVRASAITLASVLVLFVLMIAVRPGRRILYGIVASIIHGGIQNDDGKGDDIYEGPLGEDYIDPDKVQKDGDGNVLDNEGNVVVIPPEGGDRSEFRSEDYCYNVLLMGEEALYSYGARGRTDLIMIATINSKEKKIKLTSLMRDMYVQIPGYDDNKLNAAYAKGGAKLLMDTVEMNLKIKLDGYVLVGFEGFEKIIDRLGGVEVSLTAEEAQYLRTHNYISNPAYRSVVAGTQIMNGNQALGYCRVRNVPTAEGLQYDFGRTARQRTVLNQLFQKYKTRNFIELASILYDCLPLVTSDISKEDMTRLLEEVVEERILTLETMQIPVRGSYSDTYIGDMSVLAVNWQENSEALQAFLFGEEEEEE